MHGLSARKSALAISPTLALAVVTSVFVACGDDTAPMTLVDSAVRDSGADAPSPDAGVDASKEGGQPTMTVAELLDGIGVETSWADVDDATKTELEKLGLAKQAEYAEAWGAEGLAEKERQLLNSPTEAMTSQFNVWFQARFAAQVDEGFVASSDIVDPTLASSVRKLYLLDYAIDGYWMRGLLEDSPRDWDGVSEIDHHGLPHEPTRDILKAYAEKVRMNLEGLTSLAESDRAVLEKALYLARAAQHGSHISSGYGVDLTLPVFTALNFSGTFIFDPGLGGFDNPQEALEVFNALWWFDPDEVNAGTVELLNAFMAPQLVNPEMYKGVVGDEVLGTKAYLLVKWWLERINAMPEALEDCRSFSAQKQAAWIDAFSAEMLFNNDGATTFETVRADLMSDAASLSAPTKDAAKKALDAVFADDSVLSNTQRANVKAAVDAVDNFGQVQRTLREALDSETGSTAASEVYASAFEQLDRVGGGYEPGAKPTLEDAVFIQNTWDSVRAYLVQRFGERVVDVGEVLPEDVEVTTGPTASVAGDTIIAGVGQSRTRGLWVSLLVHEALHVLQLSGGSIVEGPGYEGAGSLAEATVGVEALEALLPAEDLPLYMMEHFASRAIYYATTMGTLAYLQRQSCDDGVSDKKLVIDTMVKWGVEPARAEIQWLRATFGTQYLTYLVGEVAYAKVIEYFETAIEPATNNEINAYDLMTCGMPSPRLTPENAAALKSCLGL